MTVDSLQPLSPTLWNSPPTGDVLVLYKRNFALLTAWPLIPETTNFSMKSFNGLASISREVSPPAFVFGEEENTVASSVGVKVNDVTAGKVGVLEGGSVTVGVGVLVGELPGRGVFVAVFVAVGVDVNGLVGVGVFVLVGVEVGMLVGVEVLVGMGVGEPAGAVAAR